MSQGGPAAQPRMLSPPCLPSGWHTAVRLLAGRQHVADPPLCRYGVLDVFGGEQQGTLVRVAPMRELRTLELSWFVPFGAMACGGSKPWKVASHALVIGGVGLGLGLALGL